MSREATSSLDATILYWGEMIDKYYDIHPHKLIAVKEEIAVELSLGLKSSKKKEYELAWTSEGTTAINKILLWNGIAQKKTPSFHRLATTTSQNQLIVCEDKGSKIEWSRS